MLFFLAWINQTQQPKEIVRQGNSTHMARIMESLIWDV